MKKNLYNETLEIMKKYNVVANKRYGQNFLIDENVIQSIIEKAEITREDFVIEIGPGLGTLTQRLLENAGKVLAIELDKKMVNIISDRFSSEIENAKNENEQNSDADICKLEIISEDVLKVNLKEIISNALETGYKKVKVVANLPYYITTPIIMKLLEEKLKLDSITVMVQKEVAERLAEVPGGKETGAITYTIYYYTDSRIIINVPKESFIPAPEVTSAVVQFKILDKPRVEVKDEEELFKLIKQGFLMKRKTLVNALTGYKNKTKQEVIEMLKELDINERARAEELSLFVFAKITEKM